MNAKHIYKAGLFSLLAVTAACTADEPWADGVNTPEGEGGAALESVVMTAPDFLLDGEETRTGFDVAIKEVTFSWAANDTVGVCPQKGFQAAFPINAAETASNKATFNGGGWALRPEHKYMAYFPFNGIINQEFNEIPVSFLGQKQVGDNTTEHMSQYDFLVASAVAPAEGVANFDFKHLACLTRFYLTFPEAVDVKGMTVTASDGVFNLTGVVNLTASEPVINGSSVAAANSMQLAVEGVNGVQNATLYMMMPPANLHGLTVTVKVGAYEGTVSADQLKNMVAGTAYRFAVEMQKPFDPVAFVNDDANYPVECKEGKAQLYGYFSTNRRLTYIEVNNQKIHMSTDGNSISLQDYKNGSRLLQDFYIDFTDKKFTVKAGEPMVCHLDRPHDLHYGGVKAYHWGQIYSYIYIDEDYNGFTGGVTDNGYTPTGDLKAFSAYDHDKDGVYVNSNGGEPQPDMWNAVEPPTFNAPAEPGLYRMRIKIDDNDLNPKGPKIGKEPWTHDKQTLVNGTIIDILLEVTE